MSLAPEDRSELLRWVLSGAIVLCLHGGIAAAMVQWHEPIDEDESEGAIVLVELAPEAAAPMEVPNDAQPEEIQPETPPEPPKEKVEENIEPAPEPDVAMLPPPEPEQPKPQDEPPPPPVVKTPPPVKQAARPTAPAEGAPAGHSNAVPRWKTQVVRLLERNKRYPSAARARRLEGVTQLAFSIDREGHVLSARVATSSGSTLLDTEGLELLRRVEPFPPPPPELAGEEIKLTVPIRFSAR